VIAALTVAGTASADYYPAPLTPPKPPPFAPPSSVTPVQQPAFTVVDPEHGPRSPGLAITLSLVATVAPPIAAVAAFNDSERDGVAEDREEAALWILGGSLLFGPSVGHWYAGKVLTPGLGVRALGFAIGAAAFGGNDVDDAISLMLLGTATVLGGAIYDVATAGRSAREYNFEHATRVMPMVAPAIAPDGSAQLRVGVSGAF
jgi:hypothetical protein